MFNRRKKRDQLEELSRMCVDAIAPCVTFYTLL